MNRVHFIKLLIIARFQSQRLLPKMSLKVLRTSSILRITPMTRSDTVNSCHISDVKA